MGIGYQGYMKLAGTTVLLTGGGINLVQDPIYSSSAWGAGWKNPAPSAHYADSVTRYEGTVDFDLQAGIWSTLTDWIATNRILPKDLIFSPDGSKIMTYTVAGGVTGAYNMSAGFSTSEGSAISMSLGVMAFDRVITDGDSYIDNKVGLVGACLTSPLSPNNNPFPFWKSTAELLVSGSPPQAGLSAVEWSVDVSQNTFVLYTCRKLRTPRAVFQGSMDVTGSVIFYHPDGVFDIVADTVSGAYNTSFLVDIGGGTAIIRIPAVVVESDDYGMGGQDAVTNRTFSMKGMGGYCSGGVAKAPILFV